MYPKQHIIFGILFSALLFFLFPTIGLLEFLIIFLSTVLIDVDHYLYFVYKKKDWSLRKAYCWFILKTKKYLSLPIKQRNKTAKPICFLHGIEVLTILLLLAIYLSRYFFYIFIGFAFHLLLDSIDQTIHHDRIDKFSLIHDIFKMKKLKPLE